MIRSKLKSTKATVFEASHSVILFFDSFYIENLNFVGKMDG